MVVSTVSGRWTWLIEKKEEEPMQEDGKRERHLKMIRLAAVDVTVDVVVARAVECFSLNASVELSNTTDVVVFPMHGGSWPSGGLHAESLSKGCVAHGHFLCSSGKACDILDCD